MTPKEMQRRFFRLLALEYGTEPDAFFRAESTLTVSAFREGQRRYTAEKKAPFFHMMTTGSGAVITAEERLHPFLRRWMAEREGYMLFELPNLLPLEEELRLCGYTLTQSHHMFLPAREAELTGDFPLRFFRGEEELRPFYGGRFPNALCDTYLAYRPDRLAAAAYDGDGMMGMAGASEDAPGFFQIGVDVLPPYGGRGVGSTLVTAVRRRIEEAGGIPFYGTGLSNYRSWRTALRCGFAPRFVEIGCQKI